MKGRISRKMKMLTATTLLVVVVSLVFAIITFSPNWIRSLNRDTNLKGRSSSDLSRGTVQQTKHDEDNEPIFNEHTGKFYTVIDVARLDEPYTEETNPSTNETKMTSYTGRTNLTLDSTEVTFVPSTDPEVPPPPADSSIPFSFVGDGSEGNPYIVDNMNKFIVMVKMSSSAHNWKLARNFEIIIQSDAALSKWRNLITLTSSKSIDGNGFEIYFSKVQATRYFQSPDGMPASNRNEDIEGLLFKEWAQGTIKNTTFRFGGLPNDFDLKFVYSRPGWTGGGGDNSIDGYYGLIAGRFGYNDGDKTNSVWSGTTSFIKNKVIVDNAKFLGKTFSVSGGIGIKNYFGLASAGFVAGQIAANSTIEENEFSISGTVWADGGWGYNVGGIFGLLNATKHYEDTAGGSNIKFNKNFVSLYKAQELQIKVKAEGWFNDTSDDSAYPSQQKESGRHVLFGRNMVEGNNAVGNVILHDVYTGIKGDLLDYFFSDSMITNERGEIGGPLVTNKNGASQPAGGAGHKYIGFKRIFMPGDTVESMGFEITNATADSNLGSSNPNLGDITFRFTNEAVGNRVYFKSYNGTDSIVFNDLAPGQIVTSNEPAYVIMPKFDETNQVANITTKEEWNGFAGYWSGLSTARTLQKDLGHEYMPKIVLTNTRDRVNKINIIGTNNGGRFEIRSSEILVPFKTTDGLTDISGKVMNGGVISDPVFTDTQDTRPTFVIEGTAQNSGRSALFYETTNTLNLSNFRFESNMVANAAASDGYDGFIIAKGESINMTNMCIEIKGRIFQDSAFTSLVNIGGIIGESTGILSITNSSLKLGAQINYRNLGNYGGVIASANELNISRTSISISKFEVANAIDITSGKTLVGGIAGSIASGTIDDNYIDISNISIAAGTDADSRVGGLFGEATGTIAITKLDGSINISDITFFDTDAVLNFGYNGTGVSLSNVYINFSTSNMTNIPNKNIFNEGNATTNFVNTWIQFKVQTVKDVAIRESFNSGDTYFLNNGGNIFEEINVHSAVKQVYAKKDQSASNTNKYFKYDISKGTFIFTTRQSEGIVHIGDVYDMPSSQGKAWLTHGAQGATFNDLSVISENAGENKKFNEENKESLTPVDAAGNAETGKSYAILFSKNEIANGGDFIKYANNHEILINTLGYTSFNTSFPMVFKAFDPEDQNKSLVLDFGTDKNANAQGHKGLSRPLRNFNAPVVWNNVEEIVFKGLIATRAYYKNQDYYGSGIFDSIAAGYTLDGNIGTAGEVKKIRFIFETSNYIGQAEAPDTASEDAYNKTLYAGYFAAVNNGIIKNIKIDIVSGYLKGDGKGYIEDDSAKRKELNLGAFVGRNAGVIDGVDFNLYNTEIGTWSNTWNVVSKQDGNNTVNDPTQTTNYHANVSLFIVDNNGAVQNTSVYIAPTKKDAILIDHNKMKKNFDLGDYYSDIDAYVIARPGGTYTNVGVGVSKNIIYTRNGINTHYNVSSSTATNCWIALNMSNNSQTGNFRIISVREGANPYLTIKGASAVLKAIIVDDSTIRFRSISEVYAAVSWDIAGTTINESSHDFTASTQDGNINVDLLATIVTTLEEYKAIIDGVNSGKTFDGIVFLIMADIELDANSFGNDGQEFRGTLKGNATLKNANKPLFDKITGVGSIEGLIIDFGGSPTAGADNVLGAVVNTNDGVIRNITLNIVSNTTLAASVANGLIAGVNNKEIVGCTITMKDSAVITVGASGAKNGGFAGQNTAIVTTSSMISSANLSIVEGGYVVGENTTTATASNLIVSITKTSALNSNIAFKEEKGDVKNVWVSLPNQTTQIDITVAFGPISDISPTGATIAYGIKGNIAFNLGANGSIDVSGKELEPANLGDEVDKYMYLTKVGDTTFKERTIYAFKDSIENANEIVIAHFGDLYIRNVAKLEEYVQNGIEGAEYVLANKIEIDNFDTLNVLFKGTVDLKIIINGLLNGVHNEIVIGEGTVSHSMFREILPTGGLKNVKISTIGTEIKNTTSDNLGVIANTNNGIIRRVVVDITKVIQGQAAVGIMVGVNKGTIEYSSTKISGSTADDTLNEDISLVGKNVGGIAGENEGVISNSMANLTKNSGVIKGEKIGGIAGVVAQTGKIINTSVNSEKLEIEGANADSIFGGLVGELNGEISFDIVKISTIDILKIKDIKLAAGIAAQSSATAVIKGVNLKISGGLNASDSAGGLVADFAGNISKINIIILGIISAINAGGLFGKTQSGSTMDNTEGENTIEISKDAQINGTNAAGLVADHSGSIKGVLALLKGSIGTYVLNDELNAATVYKVGGIAAEVSSTAQLEEIKLIASGKISGSTKISTITAGGNEVSVDAGNKLEGAAVASLADLTKSFTNVWVVIDGEINTIDVIGNDSSSQHGVNFVIIAAKKQDNINEVQQIINRIEAINANNALELSSKVSIYSYEDWSAKSASEFSSTLLFNSAASNEKYVLTTFKTSLNNTNIATEADLILLSNYSEFGGTYGLKIILTQNIDIASSDFIPISISRFKINEFNGQFVGDGKTIKITKDISANPAGLFATVGKFGSVSNLTLIVEAKIINLIDEDNVKGAGGLVGLLKGEVDSVTVNFISSQNKGVIECATKVGVIAGVVVDGAKIKNSIAIGDYLRAQPIGYQIVTNGDGSNFVNRDHNFKIGYTIEEDLSQIVTISMFGDEQITSVDRVAGGKFTISFTNAANVIEVYIKEPKTIITDDWTAGLDFSAYAAKEIVVSFYTTDVTSLETLKTLLNNIKRYGQSEVPINLLNGFEITKDDEFMPIGSAEDRFNSIFKGNGHRITFKNPTDPEEKFIISGEYAGLFGLIGPKGRVENLIIEYEDRVQIGDNLTNSAGGLAGHIEPRLDNITTSVDNVVVILNTLPRARTVKSGITSIPAENIGRRAVLVTNNEKLFKATDEFAKVLLKKATYVEEADAQLAITASGTSFVLEATGARFSGYLNSQDGSFATLVAGTNSINIDWSDNILQKEYYAIFVNTEISNTAEYDEFAAEINKEGGFNIAHVTYNITGEIDLITDHETINPISNFKGILNGNLNTIKTNYGLFNSIDSGSIVHSLVVRYSGDLSKAASQNYPRKILVNRNLGEVRDIIVKIAGELSLGTNLKDDILGEGVSSNVWVFLTKSALDTQVVQGGVDAVVFPRKEAMDQIKATLESSKIRIESANEEIVVKFADTLEGLEGSTTTFVILNDVAAVEDGRIQYVSVSKLVVINNPAEAFVRYYFDKKENIFDYKDADGKLYNELFVDASLSSYVPSIEELKEDLANSFTSSTADDFSGNYFAKVATITIQAGEVLVGSDDNQVKYKWNEFNVIVEKRLITIESINLESYYGFEISTGVIGVANKDSEFKVEAKLDFAKDENGFIPVNEEGYALGFTISLVSDPSRIFDEAENLVSVENLETYKYKVLKTKLTIEIVGNANNQLNIKERDQVVPFGFVVKSGTLPNGASYSQAGSILVLDRDNNIIPAIPTDPANYLRKGEYAVQGATLAIRSAQGNDISSSFDITVIVKNGLKLVVDSYVREVRVIVLKDVEMRYGDINFIDQATSDLLNVDNSLIKEVRDLEGNLITGVDFDALSISYKYRIFGRTVNSDFVLNQDKTVVSGSLRVRAQNYKLTAEIGQEDEIYEYRIVSSDMAVKPRLINFELKPITLPYRADVDLDEIFAEKDSEGNWKYITFTEGGFVGKDDISRFRLNYYWNDEIGQQDLLITQFGTTDYKLTGSVPKGIVNIVKAKITINMKFMASKTVGEIDPVISIMDAVVFEGYPINISAEDFSGELVREKGEKAGKYKITKGSLSLDPDRFDLEFIENENSFLEIKKEGLTNNQKGTLFMILALVGVVGIVVSSTFLIKLKKKR